jgi:hypothetical protein
MIVCQSCRKRKGIWKSKRFGKIVCRFCVTAMLYSNPKEEFESVLT